MCPFDRLKTGPSGKRESPEARPLARLIRAHFDAAATSVENALRRPNAHATSRAAR